MSGCHGRSAALELGRRVRRKILTYLPPRRLSSTSLLCDWHFRVFSSPEHINRASLTLALEALHGRPAVVVETGTSAWGTDSTRLWASYVASFGGLVYSVDIRPEPSLELRRLTEFVCFAVEDSVEFLNSLPPVEADLVFLDSWDVDLTDPEPSMRHGLQEWRAIQRLLKPGSLVIIDDTPCDVGISGWPTELVERSIRMCGRLPGKGALVLEEPGLWEAFECMSHQYSLVLRKR